MGIRQVGQSVCAICGKPAHPGSAIVLAFGAGGRVHKTCQGKNSKLISLVDIHSAGEQTNHHVTTVKQEPVAPTNKV